MQYLDQVSVHLSVASEARDKTPHLDNHHSGAFNGTRFIFYIAISCTAI
jgi:hypothetical protein